LSSNTGTSEESRIKLANATREFYKPAMNSFIEFTEAQLSKSVGNEGHGLNYFHENGPLPDVATIKKWLRYLVRHRNASLDGPRLPTAASADPSKVAVGTIVKHHNKLCGALRHFNREWDQAFSNEINNWIFTVLAVEEGLSSRP